MDRLNGKVALITGSTKGIGAEAASLFVREGAKVVISGRSVNEGEAVAASINENVGEKAAVFHPIDVTDYSSWEEIIAFTEKEFGKLNILVNNAGISFAESVETTTPESWKAVIDANQTGVFYGMQQAIRSMRKNGEKCAIVSTASVDGHVGGTLYFAYCASKAAVEAMTRCAAVYCGEEGLDIRVNAVAPGYILTPMAEDDAKQHGISIEEYCEESAKLHPIGRLGTPLEVANAYLYLACDESSFVTGTTLMVDGGYTAW